MNAGFGLPSSQVEKEKLLMLTGYDKKLGSRVIFPTRVAGPLMWMS